MTHPNEVDETADELAQQLRRAMVVARRAAQARRVSATQRRGATTTPGAARRAGAAVAAAARAARENASLAAQWRREALAARWAAADVTRDQDPVAAAAWDERVRDSGVDPDEVRATAVDTTAEADAPEVSSRDRWFRRGMVAPPASPPVLGGDATPTTTEPVVDVRAAAEPLLPSAYPAVIGAGGLEPDGVAAADLVTAHLAETYTLEAVDRGGPPDPGPAPSIAELIAATEPPAGSTVSTPEQPGLPPALDVGLEQAQQEGLER